MKGKYRFTVENFAGVLAIFRAIAKPTYGLDGEEESCFSLLERLRSSPDTSSHSEGFRTNYSLSDGRDVSSKLLFITNRGGLPKNLFGGLKTEYVVYTYPNSDPLAQQGAEIAREINNAWVVAGYPARILFKH